MEGPIIPKPWTNEPGSRMSSAATIDDIRALAGACERREQARGGGSREEVRERLARRLGIMPGTLYTLARKRLKRLDAAVRDRLTAYAIQDLESDITRLTHELELARKVGAHPTSPRMGEIEGHLAAARALIAETGIGGGR